MVLRVNSLNQIFRIFWAGTFCPHIWKCGEMWPSLSSSLYNLPVLKSGLRKRVRGLREHLVLLRREDAFSLKKPPTLHAIHSHPWLPDSVLLLRTHPIQFKYEVEPKNVELMFSCRESFKLPLQMTIYVTHSRIFFQKLVTPPPVTNPENEILPLSIESKITWLNFSGLHWS